MALTAKTITVGPEEMFGLRALREVGTIYVPLNEGSDWNVQDYVLITDGEEAEFAEIMHITGWGDALVRRKKTHVRLVDDLDPIMRLRQDEVVDIDITPSAFLPKEVVLLVHRASGEQQAAVVLDLQYPQRGQAIVALQRCDCDLGCLSSVLAMAEKNRVADAVLKKVEEAYRRFV